MSVTVVDASAVAAVIFDEPESAPVLASVGPSLVAPTLLRKHWRQVDRERE